MSDSRTKMRWDARRKKIADDFFAGNEADAMAVLHRLPYSAVPDWGDVVGLMEEMTRADLLASPEHDAAVAARAWDEAVAAVAWAMDHGPDPLRYVSENNPYRREAGESNAR